MVKHLLALILTVFVVGCGPKSAPQTVLHNTIPQPALDKVLEVHTLTHLGFGAPISGGRLITVYHLAEGAHSAYWKGKGGTRGPLELLKTDPARDLALYRLVGNDNSLRTLKVSPEPPREGEEVYWLTHTRSQKIGLVRGWVISVEETHLQLQGWFHPGTSGSAILRADGTVVAI